MKKQVDDITKEVKDYLTFIEEDSEQESLSMKGEKKANVSRDEIDNHLIQTVLQEYFP